MTWNDSLYSLAKTDKCVEEEEVAEKDLDFGKLVGSSI
jgi:hypothetical protein